MTDGILSGIAIRKEVERGAILINPFNPKQVNPGSYDLTLGDQVKVYKASTFVQGDAINEDGTNLWRQFVLKSKQSDDTALIDDSAVLDAKKPNPTRDFKIGPAGIVLKPGIGYLMHTREHVGTKEYVPVLDGKSSIGRLFISVHETAGYGDPNFFGQFTLEVTVTHPVRVYAGMRICQVRFHTISGEVSQYNGHYRGPTAEGAVASMAYAQFEEESV